MSNGELLILGVVLMLGGVIGNKIEQLLAHARGDPKADLRRSEVIATVLISLAGLAVSDLALIRFLS